MFSRLSFGRAAHRLPAGSRSFFSFTRNPKTKDSIQTFSSILTVLTTTGTAIAGWMQFKLSRDQKWSDEYYIHNQLKRDADESMDDRSRDKIAKKMKALNGEREVSHDLVRAQMYAQYCSPEKKSCCTNHKKFCEAADRLRTHGRQKLHSFMYSKSKSRLPESLNPKHFSLPETAIAEMGNVYRVIAPLDAANFLLHNRKTPLCRRIVKDYKLVDFLWVVFVNVLAEDNPSLGYIHFLDEESVMASQRSLKSLLKSIVDRIPSYTIPEDRNMIVTHQNPQVAMYGESQYEQIYQPGSPRPVWRFSSRDPSQCGWKDLNPEAKEQYVEMVSKLRHVAEWMKVSERKKDEKRKQKMSV